MGRGRAKAIQKRIARDLKYSSTGTDLDRLRAELSSGAPGNDGGSEFDDTDDPDDELDDDDDDDD